MKKYFVDIHALQILPPSNVNRDDTGAPKTAMYGGVRRARVSSQSWKRAMRLYFKDTLDTSSLGVRSLRIAELISVRIKELDESIEEGLANTYAKASLEAAGIKFKKGKDSNQNESSDEGETTTEDKGMQVEALLFLGRSQIDRLAHLAVQAINDAIPSDKLDKKEAKAIVNDDSSIDVALFGRMVASSADLNVDAASQVAHAISVHGVDNEYDFYTAVDDAKDEDEDADAGAGMLGVMEFNSSTLYRYATVNMEQLAGNIGDEEATRCALKAFIEAFVCSMPTGHQNSYANRTLPSVVVVAVRDDQPINLAGAFETPVENRETGTVKGAACALAEYSEEIQNAFCKKPLRSWIVAVGDITDSIRLLGTQVNMEQLISELDNYTQEMKAQ